MIVKLGGDRKDGRGRSFKTLFQYVFFDKRGCRLAHRFDWAEALNCALARDPCRTWFEMLVTWDARTALKRASGIALSGRDNERPVLHLILSWAQHERPVRREMMDAATEALDWLGLAEHQACVVAHNDEPQPHVHIIINTVHPLTGKTADLYRSKRTLSAWALNWEERHGGVQIKNRVLNRLYPLMDSANAASQIIAPSDPVLDAVDELPRIPAPEQPPLADPRPPTVAGRLVSALQRQFRRAVLALSVVAPVGLGQPPAAGIHADPSDRELAQVRAFANQPIRRAVRTVMRINGP